MKVPKWVEPYLEGWSRRLEECEGGPGGSLCRGTESVSEGAESALREGWRPNWAESVSGGGVSTERRMKGTEVGGASV